MLSDKQVAACVIQACDRWNAAADQMNQWPDLGPGEQVVLIARAIETVVRTQAINDTHEANAVTCCETVEFFGAQTERGRTLIAMAKAIRAMKVPT